MELKWFEKDTIKFAVPARPTVRQQMEYFSGTMGAAGNQVMFRWWTAARELVQEWQCEALPDYKADLDTITNPTQTEMLIWAAIQVKQHMNSLEDLEKN